MQQQIVSKHTARVKMAADTHASRCKEHVPPLILDTDIGYNNANCIKFATRAELPCAEPSYMRYTTFNL